MGSAVGSRALQMYGVIVGACGIVAFVLYGGAVARDFGAYIVAINSSVFIALAVDKFCARTGCLRMPEWLIYFVALLGASGAILAAQYVLRHKSRKWPFAAIFAGIVAVQCAALVWYLVVRGILVI